MLRTGLVAALMATAGVAAAQDQAPFGPEWAQWPRRADFAAVYPPVAANLELSGDATLRCKVNRAGRLRGCKVQQETPVGYGFGDAALGLAGYFRASPGSRAESEVAIPIHFSMGSRRAPAAAPASSPPPAPTAEPNWARHPIMADYAAVYPPVAANLALSGEVGLHCAVDGVGRLRSCKVEGESPPGYGFGNAALALAAYFRLPPDKSISEISFPIRFSMPKR
jgi:TonB family protein